MIKKSSLFIVVVTLFSSFASALPSPSQDQRVQKVYDYVQDRLIWIQQGAWTPCGKTLLETLLQEWDAVHEIRSGWRALFNARPYAESVRAEDILMEIERDHAKRRAPERSIDRRREALRDIREVEDRLSSPSASS